MPSRTPPPGVLLALGLAILWFLFVALTLPLVIAEAVEAPVSLPGIVYMALLAYLIFTIVMTLQRKQAARGLATGVAILGITLVFLPPDGGTLLLLVAPLRWPALAISIIAIIGLRRPSSRAWFSEL